MGNQNTLFWILICYLLLNSIVNCYKMHHRRNPRPYNNKDAKHHSHNIRRQSLYHRPSVADNIDQHRAKLRNIYHHSADIDNKVHHRAKVRHSDYFINNENNWLRNDVLIPPGILVEDDVDELTDYQKEQKRQAPERGYDQRTQQMILDLHNLYRSNVTPPASDMRHMVRVQL